MSHRRTTDHLGMPAGSCRAWSETAAGTTPSVIMPW